MFFSSLTILFQDCDSTSIYGFISWIMAPYSEVITIMLALALGFTVLGYLINLKK